MKEQQNITKNIIFDLYGTLIHSTTKNLPYEELIKKIHTINSKEKTKSTDIYELSNIAQKNEFKTIEEFVSHTSPSKINYNLFEEKIKQKLNTIITYEDTLETLTYLSQKYNLYLISNVATPYKEPFYKFDLKRFFKKSIFSCDVNLRKPNPDIYKNLMKNENLNTNETTMIGDNYICDYKTPKEMGIDSFLIDRNNNYKDINYPKKIKSLIELTTMF